MGGGGGGESGILFQNDAINTIALISFKTNFTMRILQGFRANKLKSVKCMHREFYSLFMRNFFLIVLTIYLTTHLLQC